MIHLPAALAAWGGPGFRATLKWELEALGATALPLQEAVAITSVALDLPIGVVPIAAEEQPDRIRAKVGIFFSGLIAGCSCADDPTPVEPQNEYCELQLDIDRLTAAVTVKVLE